MPPANAAQRLWTKWPRLISFRARSTLCATCRRDKDHTEGPRFLLIGAAASIDRSRWAKENQISVDEAARSMATCSPLAGSGALPERAVKKSTRKKQRPVARIKRSLPHTRRAQTESQPKMKHPLRHVTSINDLTNDEIDQIFTVARKYLKE